jgi:acetyl-CoA C-acetyltransferase
MDAYIYAAVRTPRGAARPTGGLASTTPLDLLAQLYTALRERSNLDPALVDDVVLGCVTQIGEQGANIARISLLYAGWPDHVPGVTLNRFCASGLEAISYAALKVHAGMERLVVAGGVESMSRVPMFSDQGAWFADADVRAATRFVHMGVAADLLATLEGFEREQLDAYGVQSHQRAAQARDTGRFARSLIPIYDRAGQLCLDHDELIRADVSLEKTAQLAPGFAQLGREGGDALALARYPQLAEIRHVHHRGNSPGMADGAALVLVGSRASGAQLGLAPRARIRAYAHHSAEPVLMLTAAQTATEMALGRAGLRSSDIDRFEFNEGFAATVLKFQRDNGLDPARVNPNGGAIALGHALGASGAILTLSLIDELERCNGQFGVVAISGGAGIGSALVLERM